MAALRRAALPRDVDLAHDPDQRLARPLRLDGREQASFDRSETLLPAALSQLPPGWDLCYLGYARNEAPSARDRAKRALYHALAPLRLVRWQSGEARRLLPSPFSANLRRAGQHDYTLAYAISLEGARKLLEAQTPVSLRADWLLASMVVRGRLDAYLTEPRMFDQDLVTASYIHR